MRATWQISLRNQVKRKRGYQALKTLLKYSGFPRYKQFFVANYDLSIDGKEKMEMYLRGVVMCSLVALWSRNMYAFQDGQPMRFETPKMNEEEQHSIHTPTSFEMTCDACTAIAYQMSKALKKAEGKKPSLKGKPLPESEVIDLFETVCGEKIWDSYGLKAIKGVNHLSGDGLEGKDVPGMMQGGGKWPGRLSRKCESMVGDIGEEELYSEYRKTKDLYNFLCIEYTKDCVKKDKEEL